MKRKPLFFVVLFALMVVLAAGLAVAQITGDPAAGQEAWSNTNCKNCHGDAGEGKYAGPRAGDGKTVEEWITQVRTPRSRMPAYSEKQISDQMLANMNAYMQTLSKPESFSPIRYEAQPDDSAGKVLFNDKRCVACHGDGVGFVQRRFVANGVEVTADGVISQLRAPAEWMPMYSAGQVSDEEAGQIAEYLQSLAAPQEAESAEAAPNLELWNMLNTLEGYEWVDLTHTFAPGIPRWPGFPDAEFNTIYDYDEDGFFAQEFVHVGQYGTHMDPPAHFIKGLRTIDQIELKEMAAPLVVINVVDKVEANPDYELTVDDIKAWEDKYGPIPEGAFVAMRTDWSKRFPDIDQYFNKDESGQSHYPGWSLEALEYLYETRNIVGSGHEPPDTDAAVAQLTQGFAAETYVLNTDHYQIELLANLDQVPEVGAIVFVTVPKPEGGSGFPARVFAIVP